mmetsp:Transcript_35463/g.99916  ORF Transcript_35463/g.99916 Transcript_35463/m.99916 type:complete len:277 (-) Transcript_35463:412-1242(-)
MSNPRGGRRLQSNCVPSGYRIRATATGRIAACPSAPAFLQKESDQPATLDDPWARHRLSAWPREASAPRSAHRTRMRHARNTSPSSSFPSAPHLSRWRYTSWNCATVGEQYCSVTSRKSSASSLASSYATSPAPKSREKARSTKPPNRFVSVRTGSTTSNHVASARKTRPRSSSCSAAAARSPISSTAGPNHPARLCSRASCCAAPRRTRSTSSGRPAMISMYASQPHRSGESPTRSTCTSSKKLGHPAGNNRPPIAATARANASRKGGFAFNEQW